METDEQNPKEVLSELSDTTSDNSNKESVPDTPINPNKRTDKEVFDPEEKERRLAAKLDLNLDINLIEPEEEFDNSEPVNSKQSKIDKPKDKHAGIKPYREYQEYTPFREAAKLGKCSVVDYTLTTLNQKLGQFTISTPTYKEVMMRLLLEREMINEIRNTIVMALSVSIRASFEEKVATAGLENIQTEIRNSVIQVVITNLKANSIHYLGQAPSTGHTDITANEMATTVGDKVHDQISALINEVGDLWYS